MRRQTGYGRAWTSGWMREEELGGGSELLPAKLTLTVGREAAEAEIAAKDRALNPKLQTQFADLKRSLSALNDADWNSIPEAGNLTGKRRKHNLRLEENQNGRSYAVSDTVLADAASRIQLLGELDAAQQQVSARQFTVGLFLTMLFRLEWWLRDTRGRYHDRLHFDRKR